jgi:hypothetical protein
MMPPAGVVTLLGTPAPFRLREGVRVEDSQARA